MKITEKYKIFKYPNSEGNMQYFLVLQTPDGNIERKISEFEYMDIERAFKKHCEMDIIHHLTDKK